MPPKATIWPNSSGGTAQLYDELDCSRGVSRNQLMSLEYPHIWISTPAVTDQTTQAATPSSTPPAPEQAPKEKYEQLPQQAIVKKDAEGARRSESSSNHTRPLWKIATAMLQLPTETGYLSLYFGLARLWRSLWNLTVGRWDFRHEIEAGSARGVAIYSAKVFVNPFVSLCIATGGSRLLDSNCGIRFVRYETKKASAFALVGLSG